MSLLTKRFDLGHFNNMIIPLAKKHGITANEAEMILRAQFDFLYTEMKANDTNPNALPIKLKWLGKWTPNKTRINRRNENIERYNRRNNKLQWAEDEVEEGKQFNQADGSGKESHL